MRWRARSRKAPSWRDPQDTPSATLRPPCVRHRLRTAFRGAATAYRLGRVAAVRLPRVVARPSGHPHVAGIMPRFVIASCPRHGRSTTAAVAGTPCVLARPCCCPLASAAATCVRRKIHGSRCPHRLRGSGTVAQASTNVGNVRWSIADSPPVWTLQEDYLRWTDFDMTLNTGAGPLEPTLLSCYSLLNSYRGLGFGDGNSRFS